MAESVTALPPLAQFDVEQLARYRQDIGPVDGLMAGIDEAGRGPLAGPVVASAVIFDPGKSVEGVNDSKKLSEKKREALFDVIHAEARAVGVGIASAEEIDVINILQATKLAAKRALDALEVQPEFLVLDYLKLENEERPQLAIVKGDATSQCIAAASIIAKVTRDRLMLRYDEEYPEYGLANHKGYPSAAHMAVIAERGPSSLHRMSFNGVAFFEQDYHRSRSFHELRAAIESDDPEVGRRIAELTGFLPEREIEELAVLLVRR